MPLDAYTDPISKLSAKYLTDATATFRFDASDLMPAAVGAGAEWKQMTAWFGENKDDPGRAQGDRRRLAVQLIVSTSVTRSQ